MFVRVAVGRASVGVIEEALSRLERLDAKVKASPGQMGLDFTAPAAKGGAGSGAGTGQQCGNGWIARDKTCRKGAGQADQQQKGQPKYRPTPQVNEPLTVKPGGSGLREYDVATERANNKGGSKFWRSRDNGHPAYFHFFRDRQAVEHWFAEDAAQADADDDLGADKRRSKEWQAAFKQSYSDWRNVYAQSSDAQILEDAERRVSLHKATRGGTFVDVRIGGNKYSKPIREGFFDPKPKQQGSEKDRARLIDQLGGYGIKRQELAGLEFDDLQRKLKKVSDEWAAKREAKRSGKQPDQPVLTNPGREDPGLAPRPKQQGLNAQDVTTSSQQAAFARQQRQAAAAAGDQRGAAAWQQEARKVERQRLQGAINRSQQSQSSLFGVTEYDETMPLFNRRDSVDPVAQLLGQVLAEQLPGAQVLDWSRQPRGITAGRAVSEGLVYRFRCDADSIGYRPAWESIDERQWELRSEGFLHARDPDARMDFKGPRFRQQKTKRKCSKGYGCGSACIAMSKECRVQPSSAISKARLKQLQALAQEGDAKAAARAQELQLERDAKAQGLRQGRRTAKLEELLKDPRIAEMVRTGRIPAAADGGSGGGPPKPGDVRNVKPDDIEVDAERFQYKLAASKTGEVGSLSGVQKWDPNLAGVVSVWQDPADGKTYVINGHNRLALARRLKAEEITVRYLKAGSAKEARAIGAMQNIAEGAGSEVDAGKFFRDTGLKTIDQVKAKGLPLQSGKAEKGLALAQLPDEMFQDVVQGNLRVRRAAVIGGSGLDKDKQREVYKVLKARPSMTDETLQEYVEHLEVSTRQTQTEINLFGSSKKTVDTGLARAELSNGLKKALGREARLLGAVSKNSQAVELLEQRGGNVINVQQSQQEAQEANSVLRVFKQLKNVGPVGAALDRAAERLTAGERKSKVQKELREAVIQAMEDELKQLGLRKEEPKNEAPTMSMFDAADRFDALVARIDALKRTGRRQLVGSHPRGRGSRRDSADAWFDSLMTRVAVLGSRMDRRCQRPDGSFYGTSGQCRKGKNAGPRKRNSKKPPRQQKPTARKRVTSVERQAAVSKVAPGMPLDQKQIARAFQGFDPKNPTQESMQSLMGRLYDLRGYNAKPEVVASEKELAQRTDTIRSKGQNNGLLIYRGVTESGHVDQFMGKGSQGETHYPGLGVYGNGTYGAAMRDGLMGANAEEGKKKAVKTAQSYTGIGKKEIKADPLAGSEKMVAISIREDAKILRFKDGLDSAKLMDSASKMAGFRIEDAGVAAAIMGIDAYEVPVSKTLSYWVILNRGATVVSRRG